MKAALYVFAYSGLTSGTHLCVVRDTRDWPDLKHGVAECDALIDRARGKAASHFYLDSSRGEVMLMVDHDISWERGDLEYIAGKCAQTKGVVSGVYSKRQFNQGLTFRISDDEQFLLGEDRLVPADYVSTGFIAIHRDAIAKVIATMQPVIQGFYPVFHPIIVETDKGLEHLSEDWAFCHRARELGIPVHLAVKPKLKHEGFYKYRAIDSVRQPPSESRIEVRGDEVFTHE